MQDESAERWANIALAEAETAVARELAAEIAGYTERCEVAPAELMARAQLLVNMDD